MMRKSPCPTLSQEQRPAPHLIPSFAVLSLSSRKNLCRVTTLRFPNLKRKLGLHHGIFTRHGGVSDVPYKSLNTGHKTGDSEENVIQNLEIVKATLGADQLALMNQVHGHDILVLKRDNLCEGDGRMRADALVTDVAGLALTVRQADCQGIILFEEQKKVLALVHCGWRGNVANILGLTVEVMKSQYGCNPSHTMAAIGPSLGPCCAEFSDPRNELPAFCYPFIRDNNHVDFWGLSINQLEAAGIPPSQIELAGQCTKCQPGYLSHRKGDGGRMGVFAKLL